MDECMCQACGADEGNLHMQFLVNGLISGAIISLVAVSFSFIYATNRFVHFAHGAVAAGGAYALYTAATVHDVPLFLAIPFAIVAAGVLGLLVYLVVYFPLRKRHASDAILLIASLGVMIFLENLYSALFGANVKAVPAFLSSKSLSIFGARITPVQLMIIVVSILLFLFVLFFTKRTSLGIQMKAVTDNSELASITGIHVARIQLLGFFIGSCIAGVAGVLVAFDQNVTPLMGTNLIIKGFAGSVVGGIFSLPGAMLGSYVLGLVENLGVIFLPSAYKDAVVFVVLLLFLLLRPQGIFGLKKGVRQ
jgi:branched-chain amino acid transport system permease protein